MDILACRHGPRLRSKASAPEIAPTEIQLRWPAENESPGLIVMIQGARPDFEAKWARVRALAGCPDAALPDTANAIRLDAPDHGGVPAALAEKLLARQARIKAELRDPPPDTGTMVRVTIPPDRLAWALTVIRAAAADSGIAAAIGGSAGAGVLEVTVPEESPAADVARFVAALRGELAELSKAGLAQAVVVYAPGDVRGLAGTYGPAPSLALALAVKDQLDPELRMAPGRVADLV